MAEIIMNDEIMRKLSFEERKIAMSTNNNPKIVPDAPSQSKKENYEVLVLEWKTQIIFR